MCLQEKGEEVGATWSVHPARMHDGEMDVSVSLCKLLCHHNLLPLEHKQTQSC